MGFYDTIREAFAAVPGSKSSDVAQALKQAKVIRAHNVAEYYSGDVEDVDDFRRQLGTLSPPFPLVWIEARAPKRHRLENSVMKWPPFGYQQAGVLLRQEQVYDVEEFYRVHYDMFFDFPAGFLEIPKGEYWHYPTLNGYFRLDSAGVSLDDKIGAFEPPYPVQPLLKEVLSWCLAIYSDVMLLSLSFLNCKNVTLEPVTPPVVTASKRQLRKHIRPKQEHAYHTIVIQPLKALTARKSPSGTPDTATAPSTPQRLHIVRGHFARYSEERPLFGRPGLFGQFWIPTYVAGRDVEHTVETDYEIRLPLQEPEKITAFIRERSENRKGK